jgi:hypothetical protein
VKPADGIEVRQNGKAFFFEWRAWRGSTSSALPPHSYFVIRSSALDAFAERLKASVDKPVGPRERKSLVAVIAALSRHAHKAAPPELGTASRQSLYATFLSLAEDSRLSVKEIAGLGRVATRTIEQYLTKARQASTTA